MKKVLITGANSYIGECMARRLSVESEKYTVSVKDTINWEPKPHDFEGIDVVFNVAGIAHRKETKANKHLYYEINRDLVVRIANAAKTAGVHQFILLSSMSVYGLTVGHITKESVPNPVNAYGESKLEADIEIKKMEDETFGFACLRPPMVYGKGCKGNYQTLRKCALKTPIFPNVNNSRSMVYVGNLCEFVKQCIDQEKKGLFFPQNAEYTNSSEMVKLIAETNGRKVKLVKWFNWMIKIAPLSVVKKVFGNLTYERVDMIDKYGLVESVRLTEE